MQSPPKKRADAGTSGPARRKGILRATFTKLALYGPLTVFALITLVPFAYLACSAVKPQSVFFNSRFLPTDGLFHLDKNSGDLTVVDLSHLPDTGPATYTLSITMKQAGDIVGQRDIKVGFRTPDTDAVDFVIPEDAAIGTEVGAIEIARTPEPDQDADAAPRRGVAQYAFASGNPRGFLGIAWNLLTLDNFKNLFRERLPDGTDRYSFFNNTGIGRAIINSFFFASVSSVLGVLGAAMGGYALSKFQFRGRNTIDWLVLAALVIPGAVLIAPGYQVLYWLGLLDSYAGLILPAVAPAFGVFLFRQSMRNSVPTELIEAARIDGCGELRIFFTIAMPMVRPMAGALLLFGFLGAWNNFLTPQIVLSTPEKYPLAVFISQLKGVYNTDYGLIMAGTLVAIAPILALFLLLQKEFISGLTSGAVKG